MSVNDIQRQMMRHALGLDEGPTAYRNRYTCGGTVAEDLWLDIFDKGLAIPGKMPTWHVTRAGFAAVALPGETFDDETFSGVDRVEAERAAKGSDWVGTQGHHRRVKALRERSKPASDRTMTLPELASFTAEKVPNFKLPTIGRNGLKGELVADAAPAVVLMAVAAFSLEVSILEFEVVVSMGGRGGKKTGRCPIEIDGSTGEGPIARAALVALLRAHGVEVADG